MSHRKRTVRRLVPLFPLAAAGMLAHAAPVPQRASSVSQFTPIDRPLGPVQGAKPEARPPFLVGGVLAPRGEGALVLDADAGELALLDKAGKAIARVAIGAGAAQVVAGGDRAFVSDREHDRVVVIAIGDTSLSDEGAIATHTEPYGLALTPDGKTLLVTAVADRSLSAYDVSAAKDAPKDVKELWRVDVAAEPRGVAVSPDGKEALVTSLTAGAVTRVHLDADPTVAFVSLNPAAHRGEGRMYAVNGFSAVYMENGISVVAHQISRPDQGSAFRVDNPGTYGGSLVPPIAYELSFLNDDGRVAAALLTGTQEPRALAYDGEQDTLYVAGYGTDNVMAVAAASQSRPHMAWALPLYTDCGPTGLAISSGQLRVYCELSRKIVTIDTGAVESGPKLGEEELFASQLTGEQQLGRSLFRRGNDAHISMAGAMACASCHPEGRADGLSWRIEKNRLQTPFLAGRLQGTHPFKWDGRDQTLDDSLKNTITRLGGAGFQPDDIKALSAYVSTLPRPRAPSRPQALVERGKQVFESKDTGCASCHDGDKLTDGKLHDLANDLEAVDTPSLIGLAQSAPYFHDGSAATLRAVLLGNGTIHGMGSTKALADDDMTALIAYLETL